MATRRQIVNQVFGKTELRHPELLNNEPLETIKNFKTRLIVAAVPVVILTVLGFLGGRETWTLGLAGVGLWLAYAAVVWSDSRAYLRPDGNALEVRTVLKMNRVEGSQVARLKHQFNGKSPDFQIVLNDGRKIWVPTSKLERGHATLFAWLTTHAPQTELDEKSKYWFSVLEGDKLL